MSQLKEFLLEVGKEYAGRFLVFTSILYITSVTAEISRQILLENLHSLTYQSFGQAFFVNEVLKEFAKRPILFLSPITSSLFSLWGFASLYFSFQGQSIKHAISNGLKRLHSYISFVAVSGLLIIIGLGIISIPALIILEQYSILPPLTSSPFSAIFSAFIFLILGIPGIYLLISFSNSPFILLLENKSIGKALLESHKRISPRWFEAAFFLIFSFVSAGIIYLILQGLTFSLKLYFIQDLSLRGEAMLRVFLYSIPWAISAVFFNLAIYRLYIKLSSFSGTNLKNRGEVSAEKPGMNLLNFFSTNSKTLGLLVLIAFTAASIALVPTTAQAQNLFGGGVLGTLINIVKNIIVKSLVNGLVTGPILTGVNALVCTGNYDAINGTCTFGSGKVNVYTPRDVKFLKVKLGNNPTPEEFNANTNIKNQTTIKWKADAPNGVREYLKIKDTKTGEIYYGGSVRTCTDPAFHAQDPSWSPIAEDTLALPYGHTFTATIDYEMCAQIKSEAKGAEALCVFGDDGINKLNNWGVFNGPGKTAGCGCDPALTKFGITPCGTLADTDFITQKLPVRVDLKANGSDKAVTEKKPVTLSWTTEYATSCVASGSWNGGKQVNGSEVVTPVTGKEVFTLTCKGISDEISASDSIGFNLSSNPKINITGGSGSVNFGGSSGTPEKLKITEFNISKPLNPGDTITISSSVQGATKCTVDNGIGQIPCIGSVVDVIFMKTTTFTITGTDAQGNTVSATKTVEVKKLPFTREIIPE